MSCEMCSSKLEVSWLEQCAAVIPCLNEGEHIGPVVTAVRRHVNTVLVVDDGSGDETAARAEAAGALVLRHPTPQGKGAALQDGWVQARTRGFDWALCLDGDGQHAPEDIPVFFSCADRTQARLVVGNRMGQPGSMPWVRRLTNGFMSGRLSRLAGQYLPDTQCGYRLMNLSAWAGLEVRTRHFEIESELLLAFAQAGHRIEFVPIRVIYGREKSKINALRDAWRWWRWLRQWRP